MNSPDEDGNTPLRNAIVSSNSTIINRLLRAKADVNTTYSGEPLVCTAARFSPARELEKLLMHGSAADARTEEGETVLHCAAASAVEGPEKVRFLIQQGADFRATNEDGTTVLHAAASSSSASPQVVRYLLTLGLPVDGRDAKEQSPLLVAANHGADTIADVLLNAGANPNAQDYDGWTPLARCGPKSSLIVGLRKAGGRIGARKPSRQLGRIECGPSLSSAPCPFPSEIPNDRGWARTLRYLVNPEK